ncbi:short-chain dehydrogenase [Lentzea guizhouensis]|uniref:Short-chain dehydrogenase n=1 Tax=Lentzea guizhouensis TaxID=1586287 RepID=A0A1B2HSQ1_9PSEU|nr:SDR family NAD(P)-dependent oxidoreductase [Lentzea guizhouensis]ANZ40731.1 short-chain dehydrogenase [Lentzea guizhouensis]
MTRTAVVTAGTAGIGLETAKGLAREGFAVTVVGRDPRRGEEAVARIGGEARFLRADLASLSEVRALAKTLTDEGPLDVLVNNVGAMFPRRQQIDGVEASFVVNHLSPYLLTELLLPVITGRVVNVTSGAVVAAKKTFNHVEPPGGYYGFHWYGRAKLANLAYTLDLSTRTDAITVLAADPGGAATDMTNGTMSDPNIVSPPLRLLWPLVKRKFARSTAGPAAHAARPSIIAATDPALHGRTGVLIGPNGKPTTPHRAAQQPSVIDAVRRLSERHAPLGPSHPDPDGLSK